MSHSPTADAIEHGHEAPTNTGIHNKKLAMWTFLASDCMFFGTLISTHLLYRKLDTSELDVTRIFELNLTSVSTFVLLVSSYLMFMAVSAMHQKKKWEGLMYLGGVISFGLVFLGFQKYEFEHFVHGKADYAYVAVDELGEKHEAAEGSKHLFHGPADAEHAKHYFEEKHPGWHLEEFKQIESSLVESLTLQNHIFGSTFYVMTGLHGTHVAIGVLWLSLISLFMIFGKAGVENAIDVEVAGLYWHFVDIVWIVIFTAVYLFEFIPS